MVGKNYNFARLIGTHFVGIKLDAIVWQILSDFTSKRVHEVWVGI